MFVLGGLVSECVDLGTQEIHCLSVFVVLWSQKVIVTDDDLFRRGENVKRKGVI